VKDGFLESTETNQTHHDGGTGILTNGSRTEKGILKEARSSILSVQIDDKYYHGDSSIGRCGRHVLLGSS
jgi:hypothetical protein